MYGPLKVLLYSSLTPLENTIVFILIVIYLFFKITFIFTSGTQCVFRIFRPGNDHFNYGNLYNKTQPVLSIFPSIARGKRVMKKNKKLHPV